MSKELKPCPFCGEDAAYGMVSGRHYVACVNSQNCKAIAYTPYRNSKVAAISAWNNRAEVQKVGPSKVTLYVSNGEVDLVGLSELAKELPDGEHELYTSPPPQIDVDEIRQAIARAWCHPLNAHKEMDVDIAEEAAHQVMAVIKAAQGEG